MGKPRRDGGTRRGLTHGCPPATTSCASAGSFYPGMVPGVMGAGPQEHPGRPGTAGATNSLDL
ncbi:hypothetical protein FHS33_003992 [Streptomyces calvus]|uniref:Uncharacterized protein n=1 Tax=Streptomyces calvus TaxID=67282 RepID=A0AA40VI76_9ACTN|nr:hypothetical protein [Streptomyces calvus]